MPRRAEPLVAGEYYHVYNRGHNRNQCFSKRQLWVLSQSFAPVSLRRAQTSEVSKLRKSISPLHSPRIA
jgi:hypothetical protein